MEEENFSIHNYRTRTVPPEYCKLVEASTTEKVNIDTTCDGRNRHSDPVPTTPRGLGKATPSDQGNSRLPTVATPYGTSSPNLPDLIKQTMGRKQQQQQGQHHGGHNKERTVVEVHKTHGYVESGGNRSKLELETERPLLKSGNLLLAPGDTKTKETVIRGEYKNIHLVQGLRHGERPKELRIANMDVLERVVTGDTAILERPAHFTTMRERRNSLDYSLDESEASLDRLERSHSLDDGLDEVEITGGNMFTQEFHISRQNPLYDSDKDLTKFIPQKKTGAKRTPIIEVTDSSSKRYRTHSEYVDELFAPLNDHDDITDTVDLEEDFTPDLDVHVTPNIPRMTGIVKHMNTTMEGEMLSRSRRGSLSGAESVRRRPRIPDFHQKEQQVYVNTNHKVSSHKTHVPVEHVQVYRSDHVSTKGDYVSTKGNLRDVEYRTRLEDDAELQIQRQLVQEIHASVAARAEAEHQHSRRHGNATHHHGDAEAEHHHRYHHGYETNHHGNADSHTNQLQQSVAHSNDHQTESRDSGERTRMERTVHHYHGNQAHSEQHYGNHSNANHAHTSTTYATQHAPVEHAELHERESHVLTRGDLREVDHHIQLAHAREPEQRRQIADQLQESAAARAEAEHHFRYHHGTETHQHGNASHHHSNTSMIQPVHYDQNMAAGTSILKKTEHVETYNSRPASEHSKAVLTVHKTSRSTGGVKTDQEERYVNYEDGKQKRVDFRAVTTPQRKKQHQTEHVAESVILSNATQQLSNEYHNSDRHDPHSNRHEYHSDCHDPHSNRHEYYSDRHDHHSNRHEYYSDLQDHHSNRSHGYTQVQNDGVRHKKHKKDRHHDKHEHHHHHHSNVNQTREEVTDLQRYHSDMYGNEPGKHHGHTKLVKEEIVEIVEKLPPTSTHEHITHQYNDDHLSSPEQDNRFQKRDRVDFRSIAHQTTSAEHRPASTTLAVQREHGTLSAACRQQETRGDLRTTSGKLLRAYDLDNRTVKQKFHVEHNEEEVSGEPHLCHADGTEASAIDLLTFDSVSEKVRIEMRRNVARVEVKVNCERFRPIRGTYDLWLRKSVLITRTIDIDLETSHQGRQLYEKLKGGPNSNRYTGYECDGGSTLRGKGAVLMYSELMLMAEEEQSEAEEAHNLVNRRPSLLLAIQPGSSRKLRDLSPQRRLRRNSELSTASDLLY